MMTAAAKNLTIIKGRFALIIFTPATGLGEEQERSNRTSG
jgi:hypothetical protein